MDGEKGKERSTREGGSLKFPSRVLVMANDGGVWACTSKAWVCKSINAGWLRYCERVDFSWFSKVLSLLKVVHMIRGMG